MNSARNAGGRGALAADDAEVWRTQLADVPGLLHLPETLGADADAATGSVALDAEIQQPLRSFCERRGVSVETVLLSAWVALLHRVTEQTDLLVFYALSDAASGDPLPLRVQVEATTTFDQVLLFVADWTRRAAATPETLQTTLASVLPSDGGGTAAKPILFLGREKPIPAMPFSLALQVLPTGGLTLLQGADSVRTPGVLLHCLRCLLCAAVQVPATCIAELSLISPMQQAAALATGAGPVLETGSFEPVHTVILRNAARHPERTAVVCDGRSLTYAQLVSRATAIAVGILDSGVGPHQRIALCVQRSLDMPCSLLAILMCGGTYVPLDPLFPQERMQVAVDDAEVALLLTDGACDTLPPAVPRLDLQHLAAASDGPLPQIDVCAEDLAYIMYTSGSTGRPKGVMIPHAALRNLLCAVQQSPGFTADDVLVAITTLTFDISVMDMWLPLFSGARLVIATLEESRNPALLEALLNGSRATLMEATPGLWRALVEHGWSAGKPGAAPTRALCGGEALTRELADLLLQRAPEVWNMYGPTECTVWVSATRVTPGETAPGVHCALPNTQIYVLDAALQPVPPGITGELVIGGGNVGAGYWNRPELTAASFVPNPFGAGRLYRTGDLAQVRPQGGLRLLGRADFQVKLRGFRIELGEIEHVLARHPAVRAAVVVQQALPTLPGEIATRPLVGYLEVGDLPEAGYAALAADLRTSLRREMPEYMVPSALVPMPALPRLFNGKINRRALPPLRSIPSAAAPTDYTAPRDFLERQLADLWQTTLGIPRIGVDTSYFSLGADSLTALRLINRINRTFAMQLGLANLLTSNSIAAIATLIRERHKPNVMRALVPLHTAGTRPPLFLLHGVGGNILNFVGLANRLQPDQPVYALQAQSLLTGQPALLRLEDLATYYLEEMRAVQPHGPYRLLGYSFGGTLAAEMARQLRASGEDVALLAMLDARTRTFEEAHRDSMDGNAALKANLTRFAGNTGTLSKADRVRYVLRKVRTRSVRYLSLALHRLGARTLPSALKVAWDVNLVAFGEYKPQVNRGRLVLFRAKHQDFSAGPRDLGWAPLFPEGIDIHEIDSDHERIFLEPALQTLAEQMTQVLEALPTARPEEAK